MGQFFTLIFASSFLSVFLCFFCVLQLFLSFLITLLRAVTSSVAVHRGFFFWTSVGWKAWGTGWPSGGDDVEDLVSFVFVCSWAVFELVQIWLGIRVHSGSRQLQPGVTCRLPHGACGCDDMAVLSHFLLTCSSVVVHTTRHRCQHRDNYFECVQDSRRLLLI